MRAIILAALLFGSLITVPVLADHAHDHDAGWDAYKRGDYAQALHIWQELAESGSPSAQFNVGQLYVEGKGVEPSMETAFRWFKLAAEQGDVPAQIRIAIMYANGIGVEHDHVEALTWFKIVQLSGGENVDRAKALIEDMKKVLTHLHHVITPSDEQKATERARAWVPIHQTDRVGGVGAGQN